MATQFWFLQTHFEKKKTRMVPLREQMIQVTSKKGLVDEDVDETLNVTADKPIRIVFPIGTHFGTNKLEKRAGFYQAGDVYPMLKGDLKGYKEAPKEMWDAYNKLIERLGIDSKPAGIKKEPVLPTPKTYLSRLKSNVKLEPPSIEDGFYVDIDKWYLLVRNIKTQTPTMLTGPTGTGKTELVRLAAKRLGLPLHTFDMGSMYDPVSGLLGVHRLNSKGVSEFEYAKFCSSIQEPSINLLDELSRAPITTNNILFPTLDVRKTLPVEMAGSHDKRAIKVHDECSFVATANIGGEYTGTNTMDRALVDRFFMLELDYMPPAIEAKVLAIRTGISNSDSDTVVAIGNQIRQAYKQSHISSSISTRHIFEIGKLIKDGFSRSTALELVMLPLFEGSRTEGEKATVLAMFMGR